MFLDVSYELQPLCQIFLVTLQSDMRMRRQIDQSM